MSIIPISVVLVSFYCSLKILKKVCTRNKIQHGVLDKPWQREIPPAGYCIYCGSTGNLSKEHIIPFAVDNPAYLPKASCERCRRKTQAFEQEVLRAKGGMWAVRVHRELQSRTHHKDAPRQYSLVVIDKNGEEKTIALPLAEYPIILPLPLFPLPASLTGDARSVSSTGIKRMGVVTISFGQTPKEVAQKYEAKSIR